MTSIALASDHGGFTLKEIIKSYLIQSGNHQLIDLGTNNEQSVDYPEYAVKAAQAVLNKDVDVAIIFCGTGIGISIAANKMPGIRAALCYDVYTAKMAKAHNNANILALGGRTMLPENAMAIVEIWLNTAYEGGRHQRRLDQIKALE